AREVGGRQLALGNAIGSTMMRESEGVVLLQARPEIGVASTKAFVAMLVAAALFALRLGRARGTLSVDDARTLLAELARPRMKLEQLLTRDVVEHIRALAERHKDARGFLF